MFHLSFLDFGITVEEGIIWVLASLIITIIIIVIINALWNYQETFFLLCNSLNNTLIPHFLINYKEMLSPVLKIFYKYWSEVGAT